MANKIIQLKDGNDNVYLQANVEPFSVTEKVAAYSQNCYKIGNWVHINLEYYNGISANTSVTVATIPAKYRPSKRLAVPVVVVNSTTSNYLGAGTAMVNTDGTIVFNANVNLGFASIEIYYGII